MKIVLKEFQTDYVSDLREAFSDAQQLSARRSAAVLLNAPTGSGKTLMATTLIEELLDGTSDQPGDAGLVFLWLTDQPQLNLQTMDKMRKTSSVLTRNDLVIVNGGFDTEAMSPSRVYFLNTQKLATTSSFVRPGDDRTHSLWVTLSNTIERAPDKFVLIVDEAHRGTQGKDAAEVETIVQKFLKGSKGELPRVPLVIGISATPDHFVNLCNDTNRPLFRVDVDPVRVRESGLLKEYVDLYHPDEPKPSHTTMLVQAAQDWVAYRDQWSAYGAAENEAVPRPVLLVQVENARAGATGASSTDLASVVGTLSRELAADVTEGWLAHAFEDNTDLPIAGHIARHLAPSAIDADPDVKIVLFKTSLNTGWDCPRAEVMVSFRTAKDETNIAQLVGRMVRAPLARRVDVNEHLNTVALYLPYYDGRTVEKVVNRLTAPDGGVPPTQVRQGTDGVILARATDKDQCFCVLDGLPTQTIPPSRPMRPVARLARLAGLLGDIGLEKDPVKTYRGSLIEVLIRERERLDGDEAFRRLMDEASVLDIRRRRVAYGTVEAAEVGGTESGVATVIRADGPIRAAVADQDVEDLYVAAGKKLCEGLHKEYVRQRTAGGGVSLRTAKLELHALVETTGVLGEVNAVADEQRKAWLALHKAAINRADERYVQALREVEGSGVEPETTTLVMPSSIEWTKADAEWAKHIYVDANGTFFEDFGKSSWERKVVEAETKRDDIIGWLRNADRKSWSLRIARRAGTQWVGFYPDFIFFRQTPGGIIADLIDPHYLMAEDMPQRAVAMAQYARDYSDRFGRIEMVIYEGADDAVGKRLDLADESVREKVAGVTTRDQLKALFADG